MAKKQGSDGWMFKRKIVILNIDSILNKCFLNQLKCHIACYGKFKIGLHFKIGWGETTLFYSAILKCRKKKSFTLFFFKFLSKYQVLIELHKHWLSHWAKQNSCFAAILILSVILLFLLQFLFFDDFNYQNILSDQFLTQ
jgi:hypothetical protein